MWFIHDRPGQAEGVDLSLTETKYKLRWKQKFLRVHSLTYLVFLTFLSFFFFWKPNHLKTSPLQWVKLGSLFYSQKNYRHSQTHSNTTGHEVSLPWILTYPWQGNARLFLKTPLANSHYWLIHPFRMDLQLFERWGIFLVF